MSTNFMEQILVLTLSFDLWVRIILKLLMSWFEKSRDTSCTVLSHKIVQRAMKLNVIHT